MKNKLHFGAILTFIFMTFAAPLFAQTVSQTPYVAEYKGTLYNPNGSVVSGNVTTLQIFLYPSFSPSSNYLWTETLSNINVPRGLLDIFLGTRTALSGDLFDYRLYITFSVNGGAQTSPRLPFVPAQIQQYTNQTALIASPLTSDNYSMLGDIAASVTAANFTGILPVEKGGTGVGNLDQMKTLLGIEPTVSRQLRSVDPSGSSIISTVGFSDNSANTGTWATGVSYGEPALSDSAGETLTSGATLEFAIPANAQNAQLSFNAAADGGYITIWIKTGRGWLFQRRIDTRQTINNAIRNGNIIVFAASGFLTSTGIDDATEIRIQNETGRFRFTGMQFGSDLMGGASNGYTHWNAVYGQPFRTTQNRVLVDSPSSTSFAASKFGVLGNLSIGSTYGTQAATTNGLLVEGAVQIGSTAPSVYKLNVNGTTKVTGLGIGADLTSGLVLAVNGDADFTNHKLKNVTQIGLSGYNFDTIGTPGKWVVTSNATTPELSLFSTGFIQTKATNEATQRLTVGFRHAGEANSFGLNLTNAAAAITVNNTVLWRVSPTGVMQFNPGSTNPFSSVVKYDFAVPDLPVPNTLATMAIRTSKFESRPSLIHTGANGDWEILSSGKLGAVKIQATGGSILMGSLTDASSLVVNSVSTFNSTVHFEGNVFIGDINVAEALQGGSGGGSDANSVIFSNGATLQSPTPPLAGSDSVQFTWQNNNAEGGIKLVHTKTPQNGSWINQNRTFGSLAASGGLDLQFGLKDGVGNWAFKTTPAYTFVNSLGQSITQTPSTSILVDGVQKLVFTPTLTTFSNSLRLVDPTNPSTNTTYTFQILSNGELQLIPNPAVGKSKLFIVDTLRISGSTGIDFSDTSGNFNRGITFEGNSALTSGGVSELNLNRNFTFGVVSVGNILTYNNLAENIRFRVLGNTTARKYLDILSNGSEDTAHYMDPGAQSVIENIRGNNSVFVAATTNILFSSYGKIPTLNVQKIYDIADPYYVLDPSNISIMNKVVSFRFVDLSDQSYWAKPSDVSRFKKLIVKSNTSGTYAQEYGNWQMQVIADSGFNGAIRAINASSPSSTGNRIAAIYAWNQGPNINNLAPADFMSQNGTYLSVSSKRWKRDIRPFPDALNTILKMKGVMYTNINNPTPVKDDIGFIAEDIGAIVPSVVAWENEKDALGVYYDKIIPILVEAFKQEHAQVVTLQTKVSKLESDMAELKKTVDALKKK